jgi:hypothetical protein
LRPAAITNREIPHDHGTQYHGTQSGQRRSGDFLEGITASGRRPARMGAPVKSPDVGVFVRPGRLPARTGMTVATERALLPRLRPPSGRATPAPEPSGKRHGLSTGRSRQCGAGCAGRAPRLQWCSARHHRSGSGTELSSCGTFMEKGAAVTECWDRKMPERV